MFALAVRHDPRNANRFICLRGSVGWGNTNVPILIDLDHVLALDATDTAEAATSAIHPALTRFYDALDQEQRVLFAAMR